MCFIAYLVVVMLLFGSPGWAGPLPSSAGTQERGKATTRSQQPNQFREAAWELEQKQLLSRVHDLQRQLRQLRYQRKKYAAYALQQQATIHSNEAKRKSLENVTSELEPYLHDAVRRLRDFVEADLPFLPEERRKRLAFLEESMTDYHLEIAEKFRRVLEALQAEAGYGRSPEVTETFLNLNGEPTKVRLLRLGRVALYYLTPDGQQGGRYNPQKDRWEALPEDSVTEIGSAMQMVGKTRTMELVNLPVTH